MQLTQSMVTKFNIFLNNEGVCFRMKFTRPQFSNTCTFMEITPVTDKYLDSSILNVSDDFIELMYSWFKENYDINLNCNNTASIFWSNNTDCEEE